MKKIIVVLMLLMAISLGAIGMDKFVHAGGSYIVYDVVFNFTLHGTHMSLNKCEGIAFWTSLSLGVGKELYDVSQEEVFNEKDMAANMVGIVSAIIKNRLILKMEYKKIMLFFSENGVSLSMRF